MTDMTDEAATRIKALMDVTQSLSEIFAKENHLMANNRASEIAPLQGEKSRLAAAYAQAISALADDRVLIGQADLGLIEELRAITETFEARAARQRSLLETIARETAEASIVQDGAHENA